MESGILWDRKEWNSGIWKGQIKKFTGMEQSGIRNRMNYYLEVLNYKFKLLKYNLKYKTKEH